MRRKIVESGFICINISEGAKGFRMMVTRHSVGRSANYPMNKRKLRGQHKDKTLSESLGDTIGRQGG